MNIGIIVFSETGNTKGVADLLEQKLSAAGHSVKTEQVVPEGNAKPGMRNIKFSLKPIAGPYDGVIFASPVQAFSLAAGMKTYLQQVDSLKNKKIAAVVTKQLPGKWTGGNQAIGGIKKLCRKAGGSLAESGIIVWSSPKRVQMIEEVTNRVTECFR